MEIERSRHNQSQQIFSNRPLETHTFPRSCGVGLAEALGRQQGSEVRIWWFPKIQVYLPEDGSKYSIEMLKLRHCKRNNMCVLSLPKNLQIWGSLHDMDFNSMGG